MGLWRSVGLPAGAYVTPIDDTTLIPHIPRRHLPKPQKIPAPENAPAAEDEPPPF